jgi:uncharacterized surface protein with fasciclin (FAS1) repeats
MQLTYFLFPALSVGIAAQSITAALAAHNNTLSTLTSVLGNYPALVNQLASAKDITVVAPSNDAFKAFLASKAGKAATTEDVEAVLTYHVLPAVYPSSAVTKEAQFLPTLLTNAAYSSVTGGQRLKAVAVGHNVYLTGGSKVASKVETAVSRNYLAPIDHTFILSLGYQVRWRCHSRHR